MPASGTSGASRVSTTGGGAELSVVVPVHDRPDLLARCLESLARWRTALDLVVVDDGSSDPGVAAIAARAGTSLPAARWLRNEAACGFSAAVNRGLEASHGARILLLNSDTEVRPGGDDALAAAFAGTSSAAASAARVGAVAARLVYPDGRPQWSGGAEPGAAWLFALASGLGASTGRLRRRGPSGFVGGDVDWAPAAALALDRAAWRATGPFDESYRHYAQDLDYGHRLRRAGYRLRVEPGFEVVHHLGGSANALAEDGQRLDLLWSDLVRWFARARGVPAARRARRILRLGGRFRALAARFAGDRSRRERALAANAALAALGDLGKLAGEAPVSPSGP